MPTQTFILNGKTVTVDVHDDVRVLWVLRDLLGVTGPSTAAASTSARPARRTSTAGRSTRARCGSATSQPDDEVTTIEGLPDTVGADLHPMQQAWLERDVAQCGYCQPGQIMAAVALVNKARREGREVTETDLQGIRNICRCGSYTRIREAIEQGARAM